MANKKRGKGYKQSIGKAGEEVAQRFLEKEQGWHFLEVNYSCPLGEIDIVAKDGETIVFVEVRSTAMAGYEVLGESINHRKQKKIKQVAVYYLKARQAYELPCRFDVLLVELDPATMGKKEITWIQDAF